MVLIETVVQVEALVQEDQVNKPEDQAHQVKATMAGTVQTVTGPDPVGAVRVPLVKVQATVLRQPVLAVLVQRLQLPGQALLEPVVVVELVALCKALEALVEAVLGATLPVHPELPEPPIPAVEVARVLTPTNPAVLAVAVW